MLSLASNISSTQVVESKYSGVFDGTEDFVDCGLIDFNTNDFSVSCWIKVREWTQYSVIWGNRSDSSNSNIGVGLRTTGVTGELQLFSDWGTPTDSSIVTGVPADTWVHVVCTGDRDGNQVIYLNDDDATTTTDISDRSSVDFTSNLEFRIGRSHGTLYHNMSISQLGIWNVALSANAVEALYNNGKPINLRINQGNYTSSSNLQQYYKFGNGLFDDKANGIVHDQDNPGFGSNLVTWDGSTTGDWSLAYANTTLSANSGRLRATANASGAYGVSQSFTTEVGKVYKVDFNINVDNAEGGSGNLRVATDSVLGSNITTLSTSTEIGTGYFTATATTTHIGLVDTADNSSNYLELESISVKKINGNPGVTSGGVTFSSDTP